MADRTSKLKLVIAGDNKGAVSAVTGTERALGGLSAKSKGLAAGLAGAFSAAAVVSFAKASVSAYDQYAGSVARIKRLTGDTAEGASLLAYRTQQAGIEAGKASTAWAILSKNIANGKVAKDGIVTTDATGHLLGFDKVLANIEAKYRELPTAAEKAKLATDVFGRGGADMGKVLAQSTADIEAQRKEMERYGLEFNADGLKKYQEFKQAQRDMNAAVLGVEVSIAQKLIPTLDSLFKHIASGSATLHDWIGPLAGPAEAAIPVLIGVGLAMKVVGGAASLASAPITALGSALGITTGSSEALAAASAVAAEAAATEAVAVEALALALTSETATAAEVVAASEALAVARTEAAAAAVAEGEASAGASAGLGAIGAAGPAAAAGMLVLGGAFLSVQKDAADAKANVDSLVASLNAGDTPAEALGKKIASTLSGSTGGFKGVGGSSAELAKSLKATGTSAKELQAALAGTDDDWQKFIDGLTGGRNKDELARTAPKLLTLVTNLEQFRKEADKAGLTYEEQQRLLKELGVATDGTTGSTKDHTTAIDADAASIKKWNDAQHASSVKAFDDVVQTHQAQLDLADSKDAVTKAAGDLATAEKEATGNSDEYRQALQDERDATQGVADAQRSAADAQQTLHDARAQAIRDLISLHEKVVQSGDDEIAAADAAARAAHEAERKRADPRASALDKAEAQHQATAAQHDATAAAVAHQQAIQDDAAAQKAGVEGDKDVVAAKQGVADANDKVRQAERRVADTTRAAAKVITDAKGRVTDAAKTLTTAQEAERSKQREVEAAIYGTTAANLHYIEGLMHQRDALAPGSELRKNLDDYITQLAKVAVLNGNAPAWAFPLVAAATAGGGSSSGAPSSGSTVPPGRPPPEGPHSKPNGLLDGSGPKIVINNINQGTPTQQRRANEHATKQALDKLWRQTG